MAAAAGSGTGKTTTAVEVVAEAVVRELDRAPERNPFESILVTTFTRDAARQLKTELKERLREHREAAPPDDPVVRRWDDLLRWLESASHVQTLDSFAQDLLREVAPEVGVTPAFTVADGVRRADLLGAVFAAIESDPELAGAVERLERAFPAAGSPAGGDDATESEDGPPGDWRSMVAAVHRSCREFGTSVPEARRRLLRSVAAMHAGREPTDFEDVLAIVDALTDFDREHARATIREPERWVEYARETYRESHRLAGAFGRVLAAFDREYDRRSRERGVLTHTDITYVVREYLEGDADEEREGDGEESAAAERRRAFRESLAGRFRHVVVDEFQDTNYAQCRVLARLVGGRTLLIGDLKQSVYEWRSAEPRLFARLLDYADGDAAGNVLDAERVHRVDLTENFRSHPHLVRAANHLFPRIFDDRGRGGIGTFDVSYEPLTARRPETDPEEAHVHAVDVDRPDDDEKDDRSRRERLVEREAERVAGVLRTALEEGRALRVDRDPAVRTDEGDDGASTGGQTTLGEHEGGGSTDATRTEPLRAGDVAVLFRSRRYMRLYSRVLDRYGIDSAVIGTRSLFREPEVETLIDALSWLERPEDPARTRRVVESALVGLSTGARERLAATGYDLDRALAAWKGAAGDRRELEALRDLRETVRYVRDGSKADLVADLLTHSAFDVTALADGDGLQRYANVRRFVEVVAGWESDDHLPYGEFVRRLEGLRSGRVEDDTAPAAVADMDSPGTVKLLTAHTAKGLEFPVVVLADTTTDEAYRQACDEPFVADRRHGVALRPVAGHDPPPPGELPTFRGGWYHDDDAGFDLDRGLLWLAEVRDGEGRLRHDHPLTPHLRDRRAEFWRLLYVAVTRASDHLVVPLAPTRSGEWTTWAAALAEHLDPGDVEAGTTATLDTDEGPLPVGVDEIEAADPPAGETTELADLLAGAGGSRDARDGRASPDRSVGPAAVSTAEAGAVDRPPALGRLLAGREDALGLAPHARTAAATAASDDKTATAASDGETPPDRVGPEGVPDDRLAALLRAAVVAADREDAVDAPGPVVDRLLDAAPVEDGDDVRAWLLDALADYRATDLRAEVAESERVLAGVPLTIPRDDVTGDETAGRATLLRGRADLLYRSDGGEGDTGDWQAVLVRPPATAGDGTGRRIERVERVDAGVTAALLAARGTEPASVTVCRLPGGDCRAVDPSAVDADAVLEALGELRVDGEGLSRRE